MWMRFNMCVYCRKYRRRWKAQKNWNEKCLWLNHPMADLTDCLHISSYLFGLVLLILRSVYPIFCIPYTRTHNFEEIIGKTFRYGFQIQTQIKKNTQNKQINKTTSIHTEIVTSKLQILYCLIFIFQLKTCALLLDFVLLFYNCHFNRDCHFIYEIWVFPMSFALFSSFLFFFL